MPLDARQRQGDGEYIYQIVRSLLSNWSAVAFRDWFQDFDASSAEAVIRRLVIKYEKKAVVLIVVLVHNE